VANLIPIPSPARRRGQYIVPLLTGEGFRVRLNIRTTKIVRERKKKECGFLGIEDKTCVIRVLILFFRLF
jgi:hypothetical protein